MATPSEWVDAIIERITNLLPHLPNPLGSSNDLLLKESINSIINLSQHEFAAVNNGLLSLIQKLNKEYPPTMADAAVRESYCILLNCLASCLAKRAESPLGNDDLNSLGHHFFQRITQLCLLSGPETEEISKSACLVLYRLSGLHFHGIFNSIILRVTSVNRISLSDSSSTYNGEQCVIQLIPHLNLNAPRLQQILQVIVTSFKDLKKHKQLFVTIPEILHKSIWNFMREYPTDFNEVLKSQYPSLARSAEKLFSLCEEYSDTVKKKSQIWPLQNTLLLLCPHIMENIAFSDNDKSSPRHKAQKNFLSSVMKGFFNKQLCEAAVVCATDMFTACTYVSDRSSQIFRYFITQMQGNLQNVLFSTSSPFLHQPSSIAAGIPTFSDIDLMVCCLVAQFRLNHRNTHTFNICLNKDSPLVFKLAFIRALHTLIEEKRAMPWWPVSRVIYLYAPEIRNIFQHVLTNVRKCDTIAPNLPYDIKAFLQSPTSAAGMLNAKRTSERKHLIELIVYYQLLQWIIKLYQADPGLAFHYKEGDVSSDSHQLMTGMVSLVQHHAPPHLPLNASQVLLKLHEPQNIELWDPTSVMGTFWDISGQVTYYITQKLFSRKATEPLQLLKWLKMILNYRTMFLRRHSQEASQGVNYKVSQQLYTMLETVLLLFLRNTDIDAVQVAMTCFKFLVSEAELVSSPTEPVYIPYAANLRPYKQLEELSKTMQIGRVAQQKRIRSILKDLVHTPGSALAWENTYSSWKISRSLLVSYNNPHYDSTPPDILKGAESFPRTLMRRVNNSFIAHQSTRLQEQLTEETLQATLLNWTNMTGFLCSLAGVSTKSSQTYMVGIIPGSSPAPPQPSDVPQGVDMVDYPSSHNGGGTTSSSTGLQPVSQPSKVKRSASLHGNRPKSIVAPPPQARLANQESVRFSSSGESLASADDPLSMRNLPQTSQTESFIFEVIALLSCDNESVGVNIRETVKEYVSGELSPIIYPYLFQGLQEELDRITTDEQLDITEGNTLFVNQVTSIVQRIVDSKGDGPGLDNLGHVKVDQVLFTLVRYADYLGSNDEKSLTLKIKICGLLQTVVQQSQELSFHNEIQFRNSLVEYLTSWVSGDLCIGDTGTHEDNLKSELDLSAMKAVSLVLSGLPLQPKDIGNDIYEEKGKLFLKYFDTFLNLIHSMNSIETSKLGHLKKAAVTRHVSSLREATILAMSNMLTANIDSGLTHAISLGYHNDLRTRTSFIEVMTSILKQGAEFHSLADSALADRYNELLDLVTMETEEGEHPIMIALINSVPFDSLDDLAELLVLLFDYKNRLTSFLTQILMTEVDALESGKLDTLFRGNTIACKVLSIAFKTFGLYYLQSVLRPLILNLMKTQENDYEVDPARLQNPAKLRANQTCLLELVNSFYDTILKSQPSLPLQLRTVCHILYQVVVEKLPDCGQDTVNSAIFLRFINPAIVSPQSYNLVQGEIPTGVRRALTLISKVLQNLANHVLFKKEAHMKVFNEFLENNFEKSRNLACSMASMGPFLEGEAVEHIPFLKEAYKHRLHSLLWNNQDRIASFAASTRAGITTVRPIFHKLNTLLAQLGAPNTPKRRPTTITARNALVSSQLEEFLDNMNNECDEKTLKQIKAKEFFYEAGYSKAGNPLFYLIVRKFRGDQLRMSYQLLYHMMIVLKSRTDRSFELIIDLTQASQLNEPDLELLIKFAAYIPELLMNQIDAVYFYNPNMSFKDYAANLSSSFGIFSHIKGSKKLVMIDKFAKFQEHIELREIRLPQSTMEFESDCGKDYIGHYLVLKQQTINRYAVIISVLPCGFVLTTAEKYIILDRSTPLKEMYHISNVREVFTEGKNSISIRLLDEGKIVRLASINIEALAKELQIVLSRWYNQQPSRYLSERKLEPKDVPGTFLNLAFLNLCSSEPWLRVAAYKLLCAVKDAFKLQIDYKLDASHDICIPQNCSQFVLDVSQQLAVKEPHLTLEFLSEVVAGFQRYSTACKQNCLAYLSPWMPNMSNYITRNETSRAEQEKLSKIFDLLVSLTISEVEMYPLIQDYVWAKISKEVDLLRNVLDSFIKACIVDGLSSLKVKVLSDTAVTLARYHSNMVSSIIINRMRKVLLHTREKPVETLERHFLWVELVVLSQFLVNLSFCNYINILSHLPDLFYLCVMMIGHGPTYAKAGIHSIIINSLNSLLSLPKILDNESVTKVITLKLVEFSQPQFYRQFGLQNMKSAVEALYTYNSQMPSVAQFEITKDPLSSTSVVSIVEHLQEVMNCVREVYTDMEWHLRWQKLARRSAFFYNPSLQTRSFLMLGVISSHASSHVITRTLKVMEETIAKKENNIPLLESIVICLTKLLPLLDYSSQLIHYLFWVAMGVLQLGESTLYAAALGLVEGCIKSFTSAGEFVHKNLADVVHPAREALLWPLNQLDREVGISFDSDFNFALSVLLFKGFSHPLSTVRTRTQELLTTLFFIHSPQDSDIFQINEHNLSYLTALFPESDIVRQQLQDNRTRLMTFVPSTSTDEDNKPPRQVSYAPLLNTHVITTHKSQILFLHFLASALIQTQIESRVQLLYEFLADASEVFTDIFPLIQLYLVPHLSETLGASHCPAIIKAVHSIIHNSVVSSDESLLIKPTYISDVGFKGVTEYFRPFSKSGSFYPTQTEALFQRYIEALVQEITPAEGMERIHSLSSLSSMTEQSDIHLGPVVTPIRRSFSSSNSRQGSSSREITPDTDILEEEEVLSCDDIIL